MCERRSMLFIFTHTQVINHFPSRLASVYTSPMKPLCTQTRPVTDIQPLPRLNQYVQFNRNERLEYFMIPSFSDSQPMEQFLVVVIIFFLSNLVRGNLYYTSKCIGNHAHHRIRPAMRFMFLVRSSFKIC